MPGSGRSSSAAAKPPRSSITARIPATAGAMRAGSRELTSTWIGLPAEGPVSALRNSITTPGMSATLASSSSRISTAGPTRAPVDEFELDDAHDVLGHVLAGRAVERTGVDGLDLGRIEHPALDLARDGVLLVDGQIAARVDRDSSPLPRLTGASSPPMFPAALLPLFTSANGWRVTRGGVPRRVGKVTERGERATDRANRDRVCESTPFLQATSATRRRKRWSRLDRQLRRLLMMPKSKSGSGGRRRGDDDKSSKDTRDNRARQLNPQHDTYWRDRGYEGRPDPSSDGTPKKSR